MISDINKKILNYLNFFPDEADLLNLLKKQIAEKQDILNRKNFTGHITASGLVVSADRKILAIFHNKLQRFLQPGGHIESSDKTLIFSAKREVKEETHLDNIILHKWCLKNNSPIIIDTHKIPENKSKNEEEHYHHDFMFIFKTTTKKVALDVNEVSDFIWIDVDDAIKENSVISKALKKMSILNII